MKLRTVKTIAISFILLGLAVMALVLVVSESFQGIAAISGLIIVVIGWLILLFFWKCPYCHTHLPFAGSLGMNVCPYCGNDLEL